jgi:hypothetical protein
MRKYLGIVVLFSCLVGFETVADASPIASDNFESYTSGSAVPGLNGGTGWSAAYNSDDSSGVVVGTQSLNYTNGGATISGGNQDAQLGQTLNNAGGNIDSNILNRQFPAQTGTPVYFSLLVQANAGATSNNEFFQVGLSSATGNPNSSWVISGSSASSFDFSLRSGSSTLTSSIPFSASTTYFIVGEEVATGADGPGQYDQINLWVDPGASQPASPTLTLNENANAEPNVSYLDFRTARFSSGDVFSVDNLQIGTTYGDVAPVPEPATAGLLLIGGCLGLWTRPPRTAYARRRGTSSPA